MIGQLNGIKAMVEKNQDCFSVLTQMKAAKAAFNSLMNKYVEENFRACLKKSKASGEAKEQVCRRFFKEIIKEWIFNLQLLRIGI